jgi:hypothetical protein
VVEIEQGRAVTEQIQNAEEKMADQNQAQRFSPRTTNILLVASVVILIATLALRFLASAQWETQLAQMGIPFQNLVLGLMGIGVFLFLLVAFDQPE